MADPLQSCEFCGSKLPLGTKVCSNCGARQREPAPEIVEVHPQVLEVGAETGQLRPELPSKSIIRRASVVRQPAVEHILGTERTSGKGPPTDLKSTRAPQSPAQIPAARPTYGARGSVQEHDQMVVVRDLSVKRGKKILIEGLDFAVDRGIIVGILGPSGAGKTTLIRVLTAEYPCFPGQVTMAGLDLAAESQSTKRIFGYVPQDIQLYEDLTFLQNVMYFGGQYGLRQAYLLERARALARVVELEDRLNERVSRLSGGQKKRVSVSTALAHNPQLIILDEPTSGLDPGTRRGLWKFLKSVNRSYNLTMLITTHFLDEAEYCDMLLIMNRGRMVAYDSPRNLKERMPGNGKAIELEMFTLDKYVSAKLGQFASIVKKEKLAELVDRSAYRVKIFCEDIPSTIVRIPNLLAELGLQFKALNIVDTSMEDAFLYFTGEHFKEGE